MTLLERYLNYLSQICEGSRKAPDGITLTKTGDMEKAIELQQQIAAIGIPEFVRLCAAQDGLSRRRSPKRFAQPLAQAYLRAFDRPTYPYTPQAPANRETNRCFRRSKHRNAGLPPMNAYIPLLSGVQKNKSAP